MRRIRVYLQRNGAIKTLIYLVVIVAVLHSYTELWPLPGGQTYVLSVLLLGLGAGTVIAQFLYRTSDRGAGFATISGLTIWGIFLLVNYLRLQLPHIVYWVLNLLFWTQIAMCFLIDSYEPAEEHDW
jgi:hypothetical protein